MNNKVISIGLICFLGMGLIIYYFLSPLPQSDSIIGSYESVYYLDDVSFETQIVNECSAFSSAYVLRYLKEEANGLQLYDEFKYKLPISGYVLPKGIITYFNQTHYDVKMYTGSLETLKIRLNQGLPVIVLVGSGLSWQHYMTLVGYDEPNNEVYFFDSLRKEDENGDFPGNRTITTSYFLSMWDNQLPIFNHLYFVIERS